LHFQDDPSFAGLSPVDHELRRRLWWICFVTDRAISLVGIPVPSQMTDEHYPVPLPVPEVSFDHPQANELLLLQGNSAADSQAQQQRSLFGQYVVAMNILGKIGDFQKREAKGQFDQAQFVYLSAALRDWLGSLPQQYQSLPNSSSGLAGWAPPAPESIWTLITLHFLYHVSHIHLNLSRFFFRLRSNLSNGDFDPQQHQFGLDGNSMSLTLDPSVSACFQSARSVAGLCKLLAPVNPYSLHLNPLTTHVKFMAGWVQSWIFLNCSSNQGGTTVGGRLLQPPPPDWALAAAEDLDVLQDCLMLESGHSLLAGKYLGALRRMQGTPTLAYPALDSEDTIG
jgi:hypothetical protein